MAAWTLGGPEPPPSRLLCTTLVFCGQWWFEVSPVFKTRLVYVENLDRNPHTRRGFHQGSFRVRSGSPPAHTRCSMPFLILSAFPEFSTQAGWGWRPLAWARSLLGPAFIQCHFPDSRWALCTAAQGTASRGYRRVVRGAPVPKSGSLSPSASLLGATWGSPPVCPSASLGNRATRPLATPLGAHATSTRPTTRSPSCPRHLCPGLLLSPEPV